MKRWHCRYLIVDLIHDYVDQKRLGCHAGQQEVKGVAPEVNLRNPLHAGEESLKVWIHPGFETQGTKEEYQVAPQKNFTCWLIARWRHDYVTSCTISVKVR